MKKDFDYSYMLNGVKEAFLQYDTSEKKKFTLISMEILNESCKHIDLISTKTIEKLFTREALIPISKNTRTYPADQIAQKIQLELMLYPTILIYEKYFIESISRIETQYQNYFSVKFLYGVPRINEQKK